MFNSSNSSVCSEQTESNLYRDTEDKSESVNYVSKLKVKKEVTIPKIIMQTWKDRKIPAKWRISPISIKKMMPDWKYVLMTDEDNREFVKTHFPDFLRTYDKFPHGIQRADAIRYMWLYIHGGLYIDLDYEMLHPLDKLFTGGSEIYLANSGNIGSYLTNSIMASKPGCKIWLKMIDAMREKLPWYYMGKHMEVMNSTGPIMLNYVVKKSKVSYTIMPSRLVMPCSVCNINCDTTHAYLKPLEGSSWISYDTTFYNFLLCRWRRVVAFIVFMLILLLILIFIWWWDVL